MTKKDDGNRISRDLGAVLLLIALWLIGIAIVGFGGDFPLNDDWSYARGVASMLSDGTLELDTWPAMTLISQVGIGIVYGKIFGFSFEVLRWSTLVNALLAVLIYYSLCRRLTNVTIALFTAALLLFNPLFFSLSFTFMTEIHFLLFVFATLFCFFRYAENMRLVHLGLATVFSILATLLRQPGILIPLSCGLVLLLVSPRRSRQLAALIPVAAAFLALQAYRMWVDAYHPELFRLGDTGHIVETLLNHSVGILLIPLFNAGLFCGLFLAPLVLLLLPALRRINSYLTVGISVLTLTAALFIIMYPTVFPVGNVFYNFGLGPRVLKGYYSDRVGNEGVWWWDLLDYVALAGSVTALFLLAQNSPSPRLVGWRRFANVDTRATQWFMLALSATSYFFILAVIPITFDRHSLPFVAMVGPLLLPSSLKKRLWVPATTALLMLATFSVLATHDYLSWNRVRRNAYIDLTEVRNIPPTSLDAGFEWNAWVKVGPEAVGGTPPHLMWFVNEDDYAITFEPLIGYSILQAYPINNLLPVGTDSLYVLEKIQSPTTEMPERDAE